MKKRIILIWLVPFALSGCFKDEFLTVPSETELSLATFFTKETDFQQAVNAAYVPLRNIVNERAWLLGEMHSDNAYYARNPFLGGVGDREDFADFAISSSNGIASQGNLLGQYLQDYQIIASTNQILATIDEIEFNADSKNNIKGQAHFLRAYAYFELVRYFGKVPLHLTPVTNRQEAALPLASEEEVYAQIVKDADLATQLLPPKSQQEEGRATSGAAKTLLANVYIVQKNWADAESLLKEVVSSNEYALIPNYADVFSNSTGNKNNIESVFEVQFLEGSSQILSGNFLYRFMPQPMTPEELVTITGTANPEFLSGEGFNIPTPDIIAAYEEGDERKDASIAYITLSGGVRDSNDPYPYIKKYAKTHAQHGEHGMNWPIYRYSEVLLFLAEALNEQGKSDAAIYLNQVRARAGLVDAQGDMREAIYHERRVELAFENKRWFDLVRTGRAVDVITAYGNRVKSNPQDYYYPEGYGPPNNAFSNIDLLYPLPAEEAALSPHF